MKAFLTGASGFIGSHLVDHLLARGDSVITLQRKPAASRTGLRTIEGDVLDSELLKRVIAENKPNEIYHLAAQSLPNVSWEQPALTHRINVDGTLNVLEAVRAANYSPAIVFASSSSIYAASDLPICEDDLCRPSSPYGISKLAADHLCRLYVARHGLRVMCARPFFLIGARKTGDVCSDWARQIAARERPAEAGTTNNSLAVGNLEIVRDFLHIEDGIAGLMTIAGKGDAGQAYNISSGRGWNLADVLKIFLGIAKTEIEVRVDPTKIRPVDERVKIGDNAKLKSLGWQPARKLDDALVEVLNFWRASSEQ